LILTTVLLVAGLVLLIGGADFLIRGAAGIALGLGLPSVVIGMTIVAFGTSTPEVVINTMAAVRGDTGLAFGNIVGSSAINLGFVLAVTAIVKPLTVARSIVSREIPMMILAATTLLVLSVDAALNGAPGNVLTRGDGLVLLLIFCVFLYNSVMGVRAKPLDDRFVAGIHEAIVSSDHLMPTRTQLRGRDFGLALTGLLGVAIGGRLVVTGAVGIATALGVPQVVIGLTLVSFGTTLPELTTCLMAARRGQPDIALGNIVGSNIFNILFIGGLVAGIRPVPVPPGGLLDLLFMAGLCVLLFPVALRGPRRITRGEGMMLLVLYLAYFTYRCVTIG
jgi:cation:H+ antiporter